MQKVSVQEILRKASEMVKAKKDWHFHILTPECQLNTEKQYALILESSDDTSV